MSDLNAKVHVIRVQTPTLTIGLVTKPTTDPVTVFEEDARQRYPGATLKPSRTYEPVVFGAVEVIAEEQGLTVAEWIDKYEDSHPEEASSDA